MQNADIIRIGIAYIEQNLKTDITAEKLACMINYFGRLQYAVYYDIKNATQFVAGQM